MKVKTRYALTQVRKHSIGLILSLLALVICVSFLFPLRADFCADQKCISHPIATTFFLIFLKITNEYGSAITAIATTAVALFTWTLYCATTEQGRLTERSIQLARDEFNATHRPEIVIQSVQFTAPVIGTITTGTQYIAANIIYYNRGSTPANIVGFTGEITARKFPLPPGNDLDPLIEDLPTLRGGEGSWVQIVSRIPRRDFEIYDASGDGAVFCMGTIEYADELGSRRITAYCRRLKLDLHGERWICVEEGGYGYEYAY